MSVTSIDENIGLRRMVELERWQRSLGLRRTKLEQLERSVKQMFFDLAEEEKDWAAEEAKWVAQRARVDTTLAERQAKVEPRRG